MTQERITMIKEGLAILKPLEMEIEDEGHLHVGHAGAKSGGHFKLYIVSESFDSMSPVSYTHLTLPTTD